jgi:glycosyltransferase involved in cell wall biosynthesis
MNVVVTLEQRFDRTPDGAVWTQGTFAHPFWTRYLAVFDGVRIAARVRDVSEPPPDHSRVDGDGVRFAAVPHYIGPRQYLMRRKAVRAAVLNAIEPGDALIMRVSSQLANCVSASLRRSKRPYGLEVVGDPWDVFAPKAINHPLRAFLRRYAFWNLKMLCLHACAAAYVTEWALQKRYPLQNNGLSIAHSSAKLSERVKAEKMSVGVSDVEVSDESYSAGRRANCDKKDRVHLIFVGSLAQMYKAPDVLLEAAAQCAGDGLDLELAMIGDGRFRAGLERQAASLGLSDRVFFRGQLPAGGAIRKELDRADIFVLPSRTEGLPRAMIEAMARSLPCIGSTVGGIPELLPAEDMVPPNDVDALSRKIREVAADPSRMRKMSARNFIRANDYRNELLRVRRTEFYRFVREKTEHWLQWGTQQ